MSSFSHYGDFSEEPNIYGGIGTSQFQIILDIDVLHLKETVEYILRILPDELNEKIIFIVRSEDKRLMENETHFGQSVAQCFDDATYDIDESAKCLAMQRSTASAFHSIRCLEIVIYATRRYFQLPEPDSIKRSWSRLLKDIREELHKRWPNEDERAGGEGRYVYSVYRALSSINPYRNDTMHLKRQYTDEQANDLFLNVGSIMRAAAEVMNQDGSPVAPPR